MRSRLVLLAWVWVGLLAPAHAAEAPSGPCASDRAYAGAPVHAPLGPADFGTLPEACTATAIVLGSSIRLLASREGQGGYVHASNALRGRVVLPGGSWLSASLPGVDYRYVYDEALEAGHVEASASTIGWHLPLTASMVELAPYVRAMLPTERIGHGAPRYGFEHGIAALLAPSPLVELVAGYSVPLELTTSATGTLGILTPTLVMDAGLRPLDWLEALAGLSVRLVPAEEYPLAGLDPRVALRFYPWGGWLLDTDATFPLLGRDRTLVSAAVAVGYLFDRE